MIRNFVYLDSEKLRSLSSQLFEGVTEYVLKNESQDHQQEEGQKGPVGSGQVLGNIFRRRGASTELRFLEDHAYVLFEERLLEQDQIDVVCQGKKTPDILEKPFVRVTSALALNDVKELINLVGNFNEVGEAMYRVINHSTIITGNKGKSISDADVRFRAKEEGMQLDNKFIQALKTTMSYAFQELLEAQMTVNDNLFSAPLKRQGLREPEEMLVRKFARKSQCDFNMLGIITQRGRSENKAPAPEQVADASNLKEATRFLVDHMRELDASLTAPAANEIVVDPVAIYMSV